MKLLVTGATGMLGSELVPKLLARGHQVVAVSRKPSDETDGISWIKSDITELWLDKLPASLDGIVHLAALTSLTAGLAKLIDVNCTGTERMVYLARHLDIPLYHCSTIYTCGTVRGTWAEDDFAVGQGFKNHYESSKYTAEEIARKVSATIFRPGILIGRYDDGFSPFFSGFYRPIRAVTLTHRFAEKRLHLPPREQMEHTLGLPKLTIPLRIYGEPQSALALTPVDWAAETMADLIHKEAEGCFHIVPSAPPRMDDIVMAVNEALSVGGFHVGSSPTRNPLDMFYNRLIKPYHPYLKEQPHFQTSLGDTCRPVDRDYLCRVIKYWREHGGQEELDREAAGVRSVG